MMGGLGETLETCVSSLQSTSSQLGFFLSDCAWRKGLKFYLVYVLDWLSFTQCWDFGRCRGRLPINSLLS